MSIPAQLHVFVTGRGVSLHVAQRSTPWPQFVFCLQRYLSKLINRILVSLPTECKIRYYHNCCINATTHLRHYYHTPQVPTNIQIEDHAYVEKSLCEFFTHASLFAWVSAQNSANLYNHSLAQMTEIGPSDSERRISSEQVSRAFMPNALLRDSGENATALILPDGGDNDERLRQARELRNKRMIAHGQSQRMHACKVCERFVPGTGYNGLRELRLAFFRGFKY